jgi:membrane-associated protease RseP (regulator of RpoE activity)
MVVHLLLAGLVLPMTLPLVLAGLHVAMWRLLRQPAPLFQRERPAGLGSRMAIALLGMGLCYLACAIVYFAALTGEPTESTLALEPVGDSPAARAGVRSGDRARRLDGRPVASYEELRQGVRRSPADTVELELERDGQLRRVRVPKDLSGRIGVRSRMAPMSRGQAIPRALAAPARAALAYLKGLGEAVAGTERRTLAEPVGVARATANAAPLGTYALLLSSTLLKTVPAYLILLAIDLRARRRYQASLAAAAPRP